MRHPALRRLVLSIEVLSLGTFGGGVALGTSAHTSKAPTSATACLDAKDVLALATKGICSKASKLRNDDHRHSGIGFHTPADVHYGRAEIVRVQRGQVLDAAYAAHPERFVRKAPEPPALPTAAWINEPKEDVTMK